MKELVLNSSPDVECFDYTTSGNMIASNQLQHVEPDRPGLLRNYPHQSDSQYRHDSYANEDMFHGYSQPSPYNRSDNHTSFSGQFNDSALSYGKYRDSQYDSSNQYPARSNSFREQSYSDSQSSFMDHSDTGSAQGKVILLSNLASDREGLKERVDNIFTLFSTVGQVNKVKILFKTPDKAFIEFDTEHQANNAVSMMNLAYLQGRRCSVALSKVSQITIKPQDNQDYFRDYRNSRRHRFIGKGTKHLQNIFPPSPKLHLSNLPRSITEVDIRQMFQGNESEIKNMNVLADRHMAFVELTSVALAVDYLIRLHDTKFGDLTMKVSFAKP
ncbi:MAG: Polypyrimidine tract-binding protein 2 [Marteilia pararefringens]